MPWFLLFAQHMLQFLESGTISHGVFELAVFPPYDWNTKLIESYEERDVAQIPALGPGVGAGRGMPEENRLRGDIDREGKVASACDEKDRPTEMIRSHGSLSIGHLPGCFP